MPNLVSGMLGQVATTRIVSIGIPRLAEIGGRENVRGVMHVFFPIANLTLMQQQPEVIVKALIGRRPARVLVAEAVKVVVVAIAGPLLAPFTS